MPDAYHLWLAAFEDEIPDREMRAYWNLKDEPTPTLDAALGGAAYLYVGGWTDAHEGEDREDGRCPARRVFDWLFWLGTIDGYGTPLLSARLEADLLHSFAARPGDLPAPATDVDRLSGFLAAHRGFAVLPEESCPQLGDDAVGAAAGRRRFPS